MNLLALDTATEACSVAARVGGQWDAAFEVPGRGHTEVLPRLIATLQARGGWSWSAIDRLVVGCGPGAFTGVRIGVAYAQGLARGLGLDVVPVSSLAAMAWQAADETGAQAVATAIDARAGGVYYALYHVQRGDAPPVALAPERVCGPDAVPALAACPLAEAGVTNDALVTAGTGWLAHADALDAALGVHIRRSSVTLPTARAMAQIALAGAPAVAPDQLEPTYLRDQVVHRR